MQKRIELDKLALLYLINKAGRILSRIRLQKLVCLVKFTQKDNPFSFEYKSYYYGPYSSALREMIDELVLYKFIEEGIRIQNQDQDEVYSYVYSLDAKGREALKKNIEELGKGKQAIDKIISEYKFKTTEQIIKDAKKASGMESLKLNEVAS